MYMYFTPAINTGLNHNHTQGFYMYILLHISCFASQIRSSRAGIGVGGRERETRKESAPRNHSFGGPNISILKVLGYIDELLYMVTLRNLHHFPTDPVNEVTVLQPWEGSATTIDTTGKTTSYITNLSTAYWASHECWWCS